MFSFATELIYDQFKVGPDMPYKLENIEDQFDGMCEEFLDEIFEYESRVEKEIWIKKTA